MVGKVAVSSPGEMLSLKYPRDVHVGSVVYTGCESEAQEITVSEL